MLHDQSRRDVLKLLGTGGAVSLAGCAGEGGDPTESDDPTGEDEGSNGADDPDAIYVSGAYALYPMMLVWADEYGGDIVVDGGGAGRGMSDALGGQADIGMVSRDIREEEIAEGAFWVSSCMDTVLGTINENHPAIDTIYEQGLTWDDLEDIVLQEVDTWDEVLGTDLGDAVVVTSGRSDSSGAAEVWSAALGDYSQSDVTNVVDANYNGDEPMAQGIRSDENAIGFNNINYAYSPDTGELIDGIRPVPIDLNGDGQLGTEEDFYGERVELLEAITEGVYPAPPSREEFLVSNGPFEGEIYEFVEWILTDGQAFIEEAGYAPLADEDLEEELGYLESGTRPEVE